ncbi:HMG box-containing protein 4 High mobility group protein 2-like 1 [Channa argus]|uniref:HMG box-containing protein 4 High mobility group protein 2-like 1 n=2 Tax=Channa argus TaxID=215402 RepID=A0A6G1PBH0_CHAAH|nr:HMG box-containing protein 4 High mobility group protein 2-like 1 [Channa argus]KAK2919073.1 hypothetical protein Q8A73_003444 [Channa argus]
MDGEAGPVGRQSQKEKKRSFKSLQEPEEHSPKRLYKESDDAIINKRQHSGNSESETDLCGAEPSDLLPLCPVCVSQDRWGDGGEDGDYEANLLHSGCTAEGSIYQASPGSMLEYPVYVDEQHNMADCSIIGSVSPAVTPVTHRSRLFITAPTSATPIASTISSVGNPSRSSPVIDTCSAISSMCSPTGLAWDTLRSTSRSLGGSDGDPVSAAAHLHLLGESLSLIGHHLQETDKMVSMSSSLSLLLDSLLCSLGPLICLTAQIPELKSCTQHMLAATLENIAYLMPGL